MCCDCCKGRKYWFSRKEIERNGCAGLEELATQIHELYQNGIDFSSQMTYYNEEQSDCSFDMAEYGVEDSQPLKHSKVEEDDGYFDFSSEEDNSEDGVAKGMSKLEANSTEDRRELNAFYSGSH